MALIKCPECNKDISEKASTCPHCGCPVNASKDEPTKTTSVNTNSNSTTNVNTNANSATNVKEKTTKSNILAGIMIFLFFPLGWLGVLISFFGIIWAIIELADKNIKKKGWAVASLIIFIITLFFGMASIGLRSYDKSSSNTNTTRYSFTSNTVTSTSTSPSTSTYTSTNTVSTGTPKSTKKVTKENYELIKDGMTEEEVFNILGEPQSQSESEISGLGKTVLKHYQEGFSFVAIDVYFSDGKVYMKNWTEL